MLRALPILAFLLAVFSGVHPAQADTRSKWQSIRPLLTDAAPVRSADAITVPENGPVVVTFFASWCPPCTDEFKHLNAVFEKAASNGASIIAINLYENFGGRKNPDRMTRFIERTKPQFPLVRGTEEMRRAFGDIDRIPTVVVYGRSGREVWRFVHERGATKTHATEQDLTDALKVAAEG